MEEPRGATTRGEKKTKKRYSMLQRNTAAALNNVRSTDEKMFNGKRVEWAIR